MPWLCTAALVGVAVAGFLVLDAAAGRQTEARLRAMVEACQHAADRRVRDFEQAMATCRAFFEASDDVTAAEFTSFAMALRGHNLTLARMACVAGQVPGHQVLCEVPPRTGTTPPEWLAALSCEPGGSAIAWGGLVPDPAGGRVIAAMRVANAGCPAGRVLCELDLGRLLEEAAGAMGVAVPVCLAQLDGDGGGARVAWCHDAWSGGVAASAGAVAAAAGTIGVGPHRFALLLFPTPAQLDELSGALPPLWLLLCAATAATLGILHFAGRLRRTARERAGVHAPIDSGVGRARRDAGAVAGAHEGAPPPARIASAAAGPPPVHAAGAEPAAVEPEPAPRPGLRVLLAEDGPDNQRLISFVLRKYGFTVEVVANGRQACEALAAAAPPFDLVLMDMQMPVMDGYAATAKLRAEGCRLPIIALTAHAMRGDRDKCLAAGCSEYSTKPIDRRDLLGKIASLVPAAAAVAPPA